MCNDNVQRKRHVTTIATMVVPKPSNSGCVLAAACIARSASRMAESKCAETSAEVRKGCFNSHSIQPQTYRYIHIVGTCFPVQGLRKSSLLRFINPSSQLMEYVDVRPRIRGCGKNSILPSFFMSFSMRRGISIHLRHGTSPDRYVVRRIDWAESCEDLAFCDARRHDPMSPLVIRPAYHLAFLCPAPLPK